MLPRLRASSGLATTCRAMSWSGVRRVAALAMALPRIGLQRLGIWFASGRGQMLCFQCPECGFGHHEIGHLVVETEIHCLVCYDEEGRLVRVHCWEEDDQARFRE